MAMIDAPRGGRNRKRAWLVPTVACLLAVVLAGGAGCSTDFLVGQPLGELPNPSEPGGGSVEVGPTVTVRFVNLSLNAGVDVAFYATNEAVEVLPDDLFVETFAVSSGIGFVGLGILGPGGTDSIDFPCSETLTLGTTGGVFLDNETGEVVGEGTPRWVQEGPVGLCGFAVTFSYVPNGDSFETVLTVGE